MCQALDYPFSMVRGQRHLLIRRFKPHDSVALSIPDSTSALAIRVGEMNGSITSIVASKNGRFHPESLADAAPPLPIFEVDEGITKLEGYSICWMLLYKNAIPITIFSSCPVFKHIVNQKSKSPRS